MRSGRTSPGSPGAGSCGGCRGSGPPAFDGRWASAVFTSSAAWTSWSAVRCATPLRACTFGPPSSSAVTCSRVTRSTIAGPVRNIFASGPAMTVRSPSAGEYAAPPAHGPPITLICGTRASACARKIREYACSAPTPSWSRAPPECGKPTTGTPSLAAWSIVRAIVSPPFSPSEPPLKPPSCAHAQTGRPFTLPLPASTPSPTAVRTGLNVPGSNSSSRRARATMARGPPSRTTSKTALIQAPGKSRERSCGSCGWSCLGDRQACVLAAEPERVRQRELEPRRLARALGHVVEVAIGVGLLVVQRRRQHAAAHRLDAHERLDRAGRAEQVPDRQLRRGHRRRGIRAVEDRLDRDRLDLVVERRAGPVGVDVADVARGGARVLERREHRLARAAALGVRLGDVEGVVRGPVAGDAAEDLRAAGLGVLGAFEHEHRRALAHDEAVAARVERA